MVDYEVVSSTEWDAMPPTKVYGKAFSIKRNQIPDLRMFRKRVRQEGWVSNRQFKTRSSAQRLIRELEKVYNRPQVVYSVYEFQQNAWDGKKFCVLALPCN